MSDSSYDAIIVGGGIIGCSIAYHLLKADSRLKVCVVEMDPSYSYASTTLSVANVRVQFTVEENIQISLYALDFLERFGEEMAVGGEESDVGFRHQGNLFLVDEAEREQAEKRLALQKSLGCQVEWLSPAEIERRFPLYDAGRYAGGTFGIQDGTIDAYAVLMAYRAKARSLGAQFLHGEVVGILRHRSRVTGVRLASGGRLAANMVVNCSGAWAAQIAQTAGVRLPVKPQKCQVFVLDTEVKPDDALPLTILPSGLCILDETGGLILCVRSIEESSQIDFTLERSRFTDLLWEELIEFVPAFDRLKLVRGWVGLFAMNTLDSNAILGEWPELDGFFLANGFSGHGFQQSHAVGRYLAELITGRAPTLDLSVFGPQRILEHRPILEGLAGGSSGHD
jgi:FAD-dependent oxidoreductase domain-containing protein 1